MNTYGGGCLCGAVRFEVQGPAKFACYCHCRSCQKAAGAPVVAWATFARETFRVTSGDMAVCHSSPGVTRGFCRKCGTSLTYEHERRATDIDITTPSLDDPSRFPPQAHIWLEHKLPWLAIDDHLPRYPETVR